MPVLPAAGFISNSTRTEGEVKQALEDMILVARQMPGGDSKQTLTISAGTAAPTATTTSAYEIGSEGAATYDDLANIGVTNFPPGSIIGIALKDNAEVITVKNLATGSGEISLIEGQDVVLGDVKESLILRLNNAGTIWEEMGRDLISNAVFDQVAHGFVIGDVVRMNGSTHQKAQADSEVNAAAYGIVSLTAGVDKFKVALPGDIIYGLSGLTAGTTFFLDASTAGALTSTAPTISRSAVLALSTTSGVVLGLASGGAGSGGGVQVATIQDVKAFNVNAKTGVVGVQVRELNTLDDPDSIVDSFASDQFGLVAGKYKISIGCASYTALNAGIAYLEDTGSVIYFLGSTIFTVAAAGAWSRGTGVVDIASTKVFELKVNMTTAGSERLGRAHLIAARDNIYAEVVIVKIG